MATQVFSFHMAYAGLEDRIWRDVEVSSKMRMDQLGYVVLSTFDTMACHLFEIEYGGKIYSVPDLDNPSEYLDLADFTLADLALKIGEQMKLTYDFGTEQHFLLTLTAARDMKRGEGRHFPWVTAMNGRGIIDDMLVEELAELIQQIDKNGKTDEPIYYSRDGIEDCTFLPAPWDINHFDLKTENALLKYSVDETEQGYAPFWEDKRLMENPIVISNGVLQTPRSAKQKDPPSGEELCRRFLKAVLSQEPTELRKLFQKNAMIEWPCTNEQFSLEEYIRANCEYPGQWDGKIVSVIPSAEQTVLITKVWPKGEGASFHCVSIIRMMKNKIVSLVEYWSYDGPAPQWRREMEIGKPLEKEHSK